MVTSRGRTWTLLDKEKLLSVQISAFDIGIVMCIEKIGIFVLINFSETSMVVLIF